MAQTKIGVLGGTFDPIHMAHLVVAEEARVMLSLEKVLFVPTGQPWLKAHRRVTPAPHRLEMVRRGIVSNPYFEVSTVDVDRPGPTYTVDTIADLQRQWEGEAAFYFILGMDALLGLPLWKEPARLIEMCHLVVVRRPGWESFDLEPLEDAVPGLSRRLTSLAIPLLGISSDSLRERVAQGHPIRYQVPLAVEEYIREHGLYRS
ncbi:MAG: nicotinate-nucleotide adenylyltransferase [Chloroflexi bacterium]|nr:nicotinate-nucleotide adenylyltransferase [Chloroflexota bacterium]